MRERERCRHKTPCAYCDVASFIACRYSWQPGPYLPLFARLEMVAPRYGYTAEEYDGPLVREFWFENVPEKSLLGIREITFHVL